MHFQQPMLGNLLDWSNPLNKDLVMHLAMNEGHGDVVRDLSMNGNHGTLSGFAFPSTVASGWNPGRTGVGLNFDGTDDCIDSGDVVDIRTNDLTVSAWIYPLTMNVHRKIIDKDDVTGAGYRFTLRDDGTVRFVFSSSGGTRLFAFNSVVVKTWQCVVATVDRDGDLVVYTNAVAGTPVDISAFNGDDLNNIIDLTIGGTIGEYFDGSIDQVRIHNRALTAKEVQDYYINPWQVYLDEEGM